MWSSSDSRDRSVLPVIFDDDAGSSCAGSGVALFDGFYLSGTGADYICGHKTIRFSNYLSGKYEVTFGHNWLCGFPDMLIDGEYEITFWKIGCNWLSK